MLDLKPFCGIRETYRPYLKQPFTVGEFTYATDGRIMLRLPAMNEFGPPDAKVAVNWNGPLDGIEAASFKKLSVVDGIEHPKLELVKCEECEGRGRNHACPDCECECDDCDGSGEVYTEPKISTVIGGIPFGLRYALMVAELPNVEISIHGVGERQRLFFRFDGGVGALMPLCKPHDQIVEIVASTNE